MYFIYSVPVGIKISASVTKFRIIDAFWNNINGKMAGPKLFAPPPPQDRVKLFATPPPFFFLKSVNLLRPSPLHYG